MLKEKFSDDPDEAYLQRFSIMRGLRGSFGYMVMLYRSFVASYQEFELEGLDA